MIVVADAETVRRRSIDRHVGRHVLQQLRGADLLKFRSRVQMVYRMQSKSPSLLTVRGMTAAMRLTRVN